MRALDNVLDIDILVELSTDGRLRTTAGAGGFLQRCVALDRPFPLGDPLQLPLEVEITAGLSADLRLQLGVGFPDFGFSQICVQCPNGECRCIPPDPPCIDGFEPLKGMKSRFRIGTRVGLEAVGQICPRDFEVGSLGHPG